MPRSLPLPWIRIGGAVCVFILAVFLPWRQLALETTGSAVWSLIHPASTALFGPRDPGFVAAFLLGSAFRLLGWAGVALLGAIVPAVCWWLLFPGKKNVGWPSLLAAAASLALGVFFWLNPAISLAGLFLIVGANVATRFPKYSPIFWGMAACAASNCHNIAGILIPLALLWWSDRPGSLGLKIASWLAALAGAFLRPDAFSWPTYLHGTQLSWIQIFAILCCVPAAVGMILRKRLRFGRLITTGASFCLACSLHPAMWCVFAIFCSISDSGRRISTRFPAVRCLMTAAACILLLWPLAQNFRGLLQRGPAWAGVIPSFWKTPLENSLPLGPLYANPGARAALALEGILPPQLAGDTGMMRDYQVAQQNPDIWRAIDRKIRFGSVFLYGDVTAFRPLLAHLSSSKDWKCIHFDHQGFVFVRGESTPVNLAAIDAAKLKIKDYSARSRAEFLTAIVMRLSECGQIKYAKPYLDEALAIAPESPLTLTAAAMERNAANDTNAADQLLDRAIRIDPANIPAITLKTQLLLHRNQNMAAYEMSKALVDLRPDDPSALLLKSRAAHEAHAYDGEVEALEKLIALAKSAGSPTATYRTYLGQAYQSAGKAEPALREYREALQETGNLSDAQVQYLMDMIRQIEERVGKNSG